MENYIEVMGRGANEEQVSEYRASLEVSVRAATTETATVEAAGLRDQCIRALLEVGLAPAQLSEGGTQSWQPWYRKKSTGHESEYRILVRCDEAIRLYTALDALEPLFRNSRYSLQVSMNAPQFTAPAGAREKAQADALADGRRKAEHLARALGITLGAPLRVEEDAVRASRSGAYGDYVERGFAGAAAAGGAPWMAPPARSP